MALSTEPILILFTNIYVSLHFRTFQSDFRTNISRSNNYQKSQQRNQHRKTARIAIVCARSDCYSERKVVPLCPLMGGEMPQKDRFKAACQIMTGAVSEEPEVLGKVEAVIYAMAEKFLEEADMKEVEEAMRMTRLGRMLVEDGREQGIAEGREQGLAEGRVQGRTEGREQGIQAFIRDKLEENTEKEKICEKLEQHFGMEREMAKRYIEKYE